MIGNPDIITSEFGCGFFVKFKEHFFDMFESAFNIIGTVAFFVVESDLLLSFLKLKKVVNMACD
jgi:hypothetical protein